MAYRMTRSGEECGNWCVQKSVPAVCGIGWIASKNVEDGIWLHDHSSQTFANRLDFDAGISHRTVVWGMWWFVCATIGAWGLWYWTSSIYELPIWLNDCTSIVTSIMLGGEFEDNLGVRTIGETLNRNQPTQSKQKSSSPCPCDEQIWDSHV